MYIVGEKYIFGTNKKIVGEYDHSLAVKCAKGTYVGSLDDGAKGGFRIDNTMLKDEMELALPLAKYRTMEAGL